VGDAADRCASAKFSALNPGEPARVDRKFFGKTSSFIFPPKIQIRLNGYFNKKSALLFRLVYRQLRICFNYFNISFGR
jgi:hypothetical protein